MPPTLNVTSPTDNLVTASQSLTVAGITNDETSSPTTDERVAALEDENAMLKTQVSAQSDQMDLYEDCIAELALNVYFTLQKGSKEMMAMLFAQRVILGKTEFEQMPAKLKTQVADILINECGLPELAPVEYGGTKGAE